MNINEKCATVIYFLLHTFEVMFWRMILYLILDIHIPRNVNMEIQENKPIMLAWECIMLDYPIMFPTGNAHKVWCQPYKEQCHNCYTELPLSCLMSFHTFHCLLDILNATRAISFQLSQVLLIYLHSSGANI